jgi:hypothetical protein
MDEHIFNVQVPVYDLFVEQRLAAESELCYNELSFTLCESVVLLRHPEVDEVNQG